MQPFPIIVILFLCQPAFFCNKTDSRIEQSESADRVYYSWVDRTRVRSAPELNAPTVAYLAEREEVDFLGQKSANKFPLRLRGQEFNESFWKIKKSDGVIGWVYGGALRKRKIRKIDSLSQSGEPILTLDRIPEYRNIISEIRSKYENEKEEFQNTDGSSNIAILAPIDFQPPGKRKKILHRDFVEKDNCAGEKVYLTYYDNGYAAREGGIGGEIFYYGNFEIPGLGLRAGMTREEVEKGLGLPLANYDHFLVYARREKPEVSDITEKIYSDSFRFFFRDNELVAIWILLIEFC